MKKISLICLFLCLCVLSQSTALAIVPNESTAGDDIAVRTGSNSIDATIPVLGSQQLTDNASSIFMYEYNTQTLMYAWNPDLQVYPSSLVKIMTALLAVEKGNLSGEVTVDQVSLDSVPYDAVTADLEAGEVLKLEDLLFCMMVGSANDAAAVIATHIAGNQETFVQMMNDRAKELGCTGTNFVNAHGIHDDQQYSTARDIARILSAALEYEAFKTVFSTPAYTVAATNKSEARELFSGNYMMATDTLQIYYDERVTGGRTGISNDGTRCLAVTAQSNGMQMISILLGAESVVDDDGYTVRIYGGYKETKALLDTGFSGFKTVQILYAGQAIKQLPVDSGKFKVTVGPEVSTSVILPENVMASDLRYEYANVQQEIKTPVEKGQLLSVLRVWNGNICVAQADLFALHTVHTDDQIWISQKNDTWNNVLNIAGKVGLLVLIVVAVCGVVFVIVFLAIRYFKKRAAANRSRKYRRGHRRSR